MKIILSNPFVIVFLAGMILDFLLNHYLEFVDFRARKKNGGNLPDELKAIPAASCFDAEKLKKICDYENAKYFSWIPKNIVNFLLLLVLVCGGFYPFVFNQVCRLTGFPSGFWNTYFCMMLFMILLSLPGEIISIPFELYEEFHVEKKFGFSNMTFKLWLLDNIKSFLISIIMTAILAIAIVGVLQAFPNTWWLFLSIVILIFTLGIMVIYPLFIAPLFNKFTPLEDGELKTRITNLMENMGFKSTGIFIVDESKRSGHSNAYFTGIGKSKRVVLYDTLVQQLSVDELVVVLGHEFGHYKLKHITRRLFFIIPITVVLTFVLYLIAQSPSLYTGFGFDILPEQIVAVQFVGLSLASLVSGKLQGIFSPLINYSSRRDEYAADKFSIDLTKNPDALISGLIKLNSENLSELFPPKIYVIWKYSHPTLLERIRALKKSNSVCN